MQNPAGPAVAESTEFQTLSYTRRARLDWQIQGVIAQLLNVTNAQAPNSLDHSDIIQLSTRLPEAWAHVSNEAVLFFTPPGPRLRWALQPLPRDGTLVTPSPCCH